MAELKYFIFIYVAWCSNVFSFSYSQTLADEASRCLLFPFPRQQIQLSTESTPLMCVSLLLVGLFMVKHLLLTGCSLPEVPSHGSSKCLFLRVALGNPCPGCTSFLEWNSGCVLCAAVAGNTGAPLWHTQILYACTNCLDPGDTDEGTTAENDVAYKEETSITSCYTNWEINESQCSRIC